MVVSRHPWPRIRNSGSTPGGAMKFLRALRTLIHSRPGRTCCGGWPREAYCRWCHPGKYVILCHMHSYAAIWIITIINNKMIHCWRFFETIHDNAQLSRFFWIFGGLRRVTTGWESACGCTRGRVWKHRRRKVSRKCHGRYRKSEWKASTRLKTSTGNHGFSNDMWLFPVIVPRLRKQIIQTFQCWSSWKWHEEMSSRKLCFHPRKVCGSVGGRGLVRQWKLRRKNMHSIVAD